MEEEVVPVNGGCSGLGKDAGGLGDRHGQADTGFADVDREQADDQGERGDDFEVDEGFQADAADAFEVSMPGDADDERGEDERGDDGLDEAKKDVGEDAGLGGGLWRVKTELRAGDHGDKDPGREAAATEGHDREQGDAEPTQRDRGEQAAVRPGHSAVLQCRMRCGAHGEADQGREDPAEFKGSRRFAHPARSISVPEGHVRSAPRGECHEEAGAAEHAVR